MQQEFNHKRESAGAVICDATPRNQGKRVNQPSDWRLIASIRTRCPEVELTRQPLGCGRLAMGYLRKPVLEHGSTCGP